MEYLVGALVTAVSLLDGWRDTLIRRPPAVSWWRYHLVKWAGFYPPLILLTLYFVRWQLWAPLAILSWIAWQIGAGVLGGKQWESMWIRWLKR